MTVEELNSVTKEIAKALFTIFNGKEVCRDDILRCISIASGGFLVTMNRRFAVEAAKKNLPARRPEEFTIEGSLGIIADFIINRLHPIRDPDSDAVWYASNYESLLMVYRKIVETLYSDVDDRKLSENKEALEAMRGVCERKEATLDIRLKADNIRDIVMENVSKRAPVEYKTDKRNLS